MSVKPFKLHDWLIEPELNQLSRAGHTARIEPRYMNLLVYLAERQGELVSADEIHRQVWAGMVVGDHSVYQAVARLRKALGDNSNQPDYIETVSKRGYRLLAPVVAVDSPVMNDIPTDTGARSSRFAQFAGTTRTLFGRRVALLIAVFILAIMLGDFRQNPDPTPPPDTQQTVAVLPFTTMEPDSRDSYLAHGMSIELLTRLGTIDGLNVLGYISSALVTKDGLDYQEAGKRLGATVLILGSLRRVDKRLLVYVEVVESVSGQQLWSRRFDLQDSDIFVLEAEIANQVAQALGRVYNHPGASYKSKPSISLLEAYDYYLLGRHYQTERVEHSLVKALEMYRKSILTDPGLASGYRGVAEAMLLLSHYGDQPLGEAVEFALSNLELALELDPGDEEIYGTLGLARYLLGEYAVAEQYFDRALSINHNYVSARMWKGINLKKQGRLQEALIQYRQAAALEPLSIVVVVNLALALQASGEADKAMDLLQSVDASGLSSPHYLRVISNLQLNRGDFVNAYQTAARAMELGAGDRLSAAQMALILQLLGESDQAWELALSIYQNENLDSPGTSAGTTIGAEIVLSSTAEQLTKATQVIDSVLQLEHQLPEIAWRRYTALLGLIETFAGKYASAARRLRSVVVPAAAAIHGTDFDLLYCNALTLSQRESGALKQSQEQLSRCKKASKAAREQGWNSHWIAYAEAQMALLNGNLEAGITLLKELEGQGFVRFRMLQNDPLFAPLRQHPAYQHLLESMQRRLADAWEEILLLEREK